MSISYEWRLGSIDATGHWEDRLEDFGAALHSVDGESVLLALVRIRLNGESEPTEQHFAYAAWRRGRWRLPEEFENGVQVPAEFHDELEAFNPILDADLALRRFPYASGLSETDA